MADADRVIRIQAGDLMAEIAVARGVFMRDQLVVYEMENLKVRFTVMGR